MCPNIFVCNIVLTMRVIISILDFFVAKITPSGKRKQRSEEAMNGRPGRLELEACDPREETSYPTQLPLHLLLSYSYSYTYYRHKDSIRHWLDHSATPSFPPSLPLTSFSFVSSNAAEWGMHFPFPVPPIQERCRIERREGGTNGGRDPTSIGLA